MLCLTIHYWGMVALTLEDSIDERDIEIFAKIDKRLQEVRPNDVSMCIALDDKEIDRVEFVLKPAYTKGAPDD